MWCRRTHCWPLLLLYLSAYICKKEVSMIKRWCIDIVQTKHEDIYKATNQMPYLIHGCQ
jgi:hypothetical protein